MTNLSSLDEEVLQLITRFEGTVERDIEDAMTHFQARLLLEGVRDYNQPWMDLNADVRSLCDQLERALLPEPTERWRSHVWAIADEAKRALLVAGVRS